MGGDGKFIFLFFLGIIVLWFLSGGPGHDNRQTADDTLPPSTISSGDYRDRETAARELDQVAEELKKIQEEVDRSPLSSVISFRNEGRAWRDEPDREYLPLEVSDSLDERLLFTDWELRSTISGRGAFIPEGVELPFLGNINYEDPIFLSPDDRVIVSTGRSPIGVSFRLNKCTGYFEQFQDFTPSLPRECPRPETERISHLTGGFDDSCIEYLEQLPRCFMPINQFDIPEELPNNCENYVRTKINYATCIELHRNDSDFYKNEWRIFLNREEELWKERREVIKLLDLNKKTVDTVSY